MGWTHSCDVPGPCPVDDTPFTACTPESIALQKARELAAAQGRTLPAGTLTAMRIPTPAPLLPAAPQPEPPPVTVSTKTYRGKPGILRDGRRRKT